MDKSEEQPKQGQKLTKEQITELAEVFLTLEKWQRELDFKRQKENQHSDRPHSPTEYHQQDSQILF